ncbi:hypothetical protein GOBAR_DD19645 [Gossypium barbadense]|nr:hypothetical protein GOBAR_DD19645 [Gossypium barbadense]
MVGLALSLGLEEYVLVKFFLSVDPFILKVAPIIVEANGSFLEEGLEIVVHTLIRDVRIIEKRGAVVVPPDCPDPMSE